MNYTTAMINSGRDVYGMKHSPLFASALNRRTLKIDPSIMLIDIPDVRRGDRSITGSNPLHDKYLYSLLYLLGEITGEAGFSDAANDALKYFFINCQSPETGLMAWGEHIYWDFLTDTLGFAEAAYHEAEEWPLWDQVYNLAPKSSYKYAIGLWRNQIACTQTGDFSRHAGWSYHNPQKGADYPRYAGQMIEVWADAFARPENENWPARQSLLTAIEVLLNRMEKNRNMTPAGFVPAFRGADYIWADSNLELARCLGYAASKMDSSVLRNRIINFASTLDRDFFRTPHQLSEGWSFALTLDAINGTPISRSSNKPYSEFWESGYGYLTHSFIAKRCFRRLKTLENYDSVSAEIYRGMILQTGDLYLRSEPDTSQLLKPQVFADAIMLMLNCYSLKPEESYRVRAFYLSGLAMELFFDNTSALPKATNRHNHYESITGGPELMYTMLLLFYSDRE